jgi:hypothetical protein
MYEELMQVHGAATRIACVRITARHLAVLQDRIQYAAGLPARTAWDRRAAAYGQVFTLLAAAAGDSVVAAVLSTGAEHLRDLAIGAGPEAAGIMASAHRRLLAHVRARDADAAAAEMEDLFRALHVTRRDNRGDRHANPHQRGALDPGHARAVGDAVTIGIWQDAWPCRVADHLRRGLSRRSLRNGGHTSVASLLCTRGGCAGRHPSSAAKPG